MTAGPAGSAGATGEPADAPGDTAPAGRAGATGEPAGAPGGTAPAGPGQRAVDETAPAERADSAVADAAAAPGPAATRSPAAAADPAEGDRTEPAAAAGDGVPPVAGNQPGELTAPIAGLGGPVPPTPAVNGRKPAGRPAVRETTPAGAGGGVATLTKPRPRPAVTVRHHGPEAKPVEIPHAVAEHHAPMTEAERSARRMVIFGFVVTIGFLELGRSWAYWGFGPANIFIGEITIAVVLIYRPTRSLLMTLLNQITRPGHFHVLAVALVASFVYGVGQVARGVVDGGAPMAMLKSLPIYYYPVLLAFGMWLGVRVRGAFAKLAWILAWVNATLGIAVAAFLNRLPITVPFQDDIPMFELGLACAAVGLIGLVAMRRRSRWILPLALANVAVLFGHQVRAEWLSLVCGLIVWVVLTRRARRVLLGLTAVVALLLVITVANVSLPGPENRGGSVKVGDIVGRAIAPAFPEIADELTAENRAKGANDTSSFRMAWWWEITKAGVEGPGVFALGHGYGFNLQSIAPPHNVDETVRSPHNMIMYVWGYTGAIGLGLYLIIFGAMGRLFWIIYRRTGDPMGLTIMTVMLVGAQFEPWLDTPFGGATTYLLLGMLLAPLIRPEEPPLPERSGRRGSAPAGESMTGNLTRVRFGPWQPERGRRRPPVRAGRRRQLRRPAHLRPAADPPGRYGPPAGRPAGIGVG
ncbi:MAG: O-antigen ligase family protein [Frankia sp.]|nr:O-antigen ligase family protein [Frankia sp.]